MQTLFEWDFRNLAESDTSAILARDIAEFAPGSGDAVFMEELVGGVFAKRADLDTIIEKAAPEWPIDKISIVDRNILRIGLYELLFGDRKEVPPKVAINEAIELAKSFGGDTSGKFVNGVLGAVYKEIGEPGKDEESKKKKNTEPVDLSKLPVHTLGGAVVYSIHGGEVFLAFVHDVFGYWTLSKGHIEAGETVEEGTKREVKEETSLDIDIRKKIGSNEYVASDPEEGKLRKQVTYFLAEAPHVPVKLEKTGGGLDDVRWFSLSELPELKMYDDILPIITKGVRMIQKK